MILGIDIGGTTAKMALVDREGKIRARCEVPTFTEAARQEASAVQSSASAAQPSVPAVQSSPSASRSAATAAASKKVNIAVPHTLTIDYDDEFVVLNNIIEGAGAFLKEQAALLRSKSPKISGQGNESDQTSSSDLLNVSDITENLEGIGVSATGQVDTTLGKVVGTNGKFPGYEGSPIKERMEAIFHVPVWVLNDANAAALGECFTGRAAGVANVLMVTLGTGVGGGIVIDHKIYGGTHGLAGEIGHFTLYQDGVRCTCGKRGCFECYASTSALVHLAEEYVNQPRKNHHTAADSAASSDAEPASFSDTEPSSALTPNASFSSIPDSNTGFSPSALSRPVHLNGRKIFSLAQSGNEEILAALDHWLDDVAAGISGLIHIFDPDMILIGGGVSAQKELLMEPLRQKLLKVTMPRYAEHLCLEAAALGNDAGVIGAARFWMQMEEK